MNECHPDSCQFCRRPVRDEKGHWLADDILIWPICPDCMADPEIKLAVGKYEAAVRREAARRRELRMLCAKRREKLPGEGE